MGGAPSGAGREQLAAFGRAVRAKIERDVEREQQLARALREEAVPRLRQVVNDLRRDGRCGEAWLFGSYAWGAPTEDSDLDLLVDTDDDPDALAARIGRALGRMVHLVRLAEAPRSLAHRAMNEGLPV